MRTPLRARVSLFITVIILAVGTAGTALFMTVLKRTAERETTARGAALGQSLARAAAEGLAAEDLDLLDKAAFIVQAEDVLFAQVYSSIWSPVDSFPFGEMHEPPAPEAVAHFKAGDEPYLKRTEERYDFYAPIRFHLPHTAEITIGYARIALTTAPLRQSVREVVVDGLLVSGLVTLLCLALTHALVGRAVVDPILRLHRAAALLRDGQHAEAEVSGTDDEIADLSREFNAMSRALRDREERLSAEKERLTVTLRSIGDGVIVTDVDGRITLVNRVAEELSGWSAEEAAGRPICQVFSIHHEKTRKACESLVARVLATGTIVSVDAHTALARRDGTEIAIEDSAAPIRDRESQISGVVLVFRDVTQKRRLEAELLKTEKMESLGVLAGGIAHDFNNLLTAMIGNISLARATLPPADRAQARLEGAQAAALRAVDLSTQLLTFSRGGAPVRKAEAIEEILQESARFILTGTNVAPHFRFASDVWPVAVDAGQMSQVFNNLTLNAVQAMPAGGAITYTVENVVLGQEEIPLLKPGDYVRIDVADEGTGIAAEHLARIFDPFFTTKAQGTGLGLTSAYSIVARHDGHLAVASRPGAGTTFRIWLPAMRSALLPAARVEEALSAGRGRILVMDDEKIVREIAEEILQALGYSAATAANGAEAISLYRRAREEGDPFRAVIMDLTVPGGMGGKEAVRRLLEFDPEACVIVSSGYSNDPVMADYRAFGFQGVIVKPYSVRTFGKTLQEILGGTV